MMRDEFAKKMKHHNNPHQPVLKEAVLRLLDPQPNNRYLDLTAGYGGHAEAVISAIGRQDLATLVDRDKQANQFLIAKFPKSLVVHEDFVTALEQVHKQGQKFDLILMDLGVSSLQLDQADRGFSFRYDAPLDMRMDSRQELTADDIVNKLDKVELADLIYKYGEETQSRVIAEAIVQNRPITSTVQLSELISNTVRWHGKIHPATRTFQAIRMVVNDELGQLEKALSLIPEVLDDGGRLAVISFHSLEDRIVKKYIRDHSRSGYEAIFTDLTKKPIDGTEDVHNPRARSAKLRAIVKKTNTKSKKRKEQ
jgi:16S rRNA (cytosine1402-N4)-methyltransferase